MKKMLCAVLASALLFAVMCIGVSADFDYANLWTEYTVLTASEISYDHRGETTATAFPRGGGTLECLIDGKNASEVTNHDQAGIVLVCNDFIKPDYEADMAMADQPADAIPEFYFTLKYDSVVTFDSVYLSLFYQIYDCVAAPGEHRVIVEVSEDGNVWLPVGEDGAFYYRNNQPEYTGAADPMVEEIIVPLGQEVDSQYVRLTFNFAQVPADDQWIWYTNVYEWAGFTELAVAQYAGGDEPEVMTQEYASAPALDLMGTTWFYEDEDGMANVMTFYELDGVDTVGMYSFDAADFAENSLDANSVIGVDMPYVASVDYIVAELLGEYYVFYLAIEEDDTLFYDDGVGEVLYLDAYTPPVSDESSVPEEESSEAVSEAESSEESEESQAVSAEESKPAVSATVSTATSSAAPSADDEGAFPIWAIALIAVAAVAVVVVVIAVVKKKK